MDPCDFKNCPICKASDDFINQLNLELMQDNLPLTPAPLETLLQVILTQDDLDFDLDF
jgi:hypothetical protein